MRIEAAAVAQLPLNMAFLSYFPSVNVVVIPISQFEQERRVRARLSRDRESGVRHLSLLSFRLSTYFCMTNAAARGVMGRPLRDLWDNIKFKGKCYERKLTQNLH